jgi:hypothetical protein
MVKNENADLFQMLRNAVPEIPEKTTRLVLTLEHGSCPVIECQFLVKANIGFETHEQKYKLTPIDGTLVVR